MLAPLKQVFPAADVFVVTSQYNQDHSNATLSIPAENRKVSCAFCHLDGKRLFIQTRERLTASQAVSVQFNDALFLGESVTCRPQDASGSWQIEVRVEQMLSGLDNLMILRSRLLGEGIPPARTLQHAGVYA